VAGLDDFQALYQETLDHGFGTARYQTYAQDKCNEAQLEIAKKLDIDELSTIQTISTVAGTGTTGLSSNFLRLQYVFESTNDAAQDVLSPLPDGMTLEELDRLRRGKPSHWLLQGQSILWYPVPDKVYSIVIRYFKVPTTMVADGDLPEIPLELRPAIVSYAVAMCYRREQDLAAYQAFMGEFNRQVLDGAKKQQAGVGAMPTQVPGMW
jgi:hypothetical protein